MMSESRKRAILQFRNWVLGSKTKNNFPIDVLEGFQAPGQLPASSRLLIDPAMNQPIAICHDTPLNDVISIVSKAKHAQAAWYKVPAIDKTKLLTRASECIRMDVDLLADLEVLSTAKPLWEAKADILACADTLVYYAGLATCINGQHFPFEHDPATFCYTRREPFGVCAGIGAWNFPLQMAVWKSAPALVTGNAMVFKPSPFTPLTALRLSQLYAQAGLPDGLFACVLGNVEVGSALIKSPDIAKVSFTGSVLGGSAVLKTASEGIKPCTLELGGKSPLIIMGDADLDNAVTATLSANFFTQGQVCSNAARVFVHNSIMEKFTTKLVERVSRFRLGDAFEENVDMGALIHGEHTEKVLAYVRSAVADGARVLCGGERLEVAPAEGLSCQNFIPPTVLTDCRDEMRAVQEEIFGPIITLLQFETEEEVLRRANATELGLAGGIFTRDLTTAHRMAAQLQCGAVYVNNYNIYPPGVPFGGFKKSGFGRENAMETLAAYTQTKSVYVEGQPLTDPFPSGANKSH